MAMKTAVARALWWCLSPVRHHHSDTTVRASL